jgi:endonuclease/exonuclease/phosphatase family metal-dependent hydrolase
MSGKQYVIMKWLRTLVIMVLALAGLFCFLLILATLADFKPEPVEKAEVQGTAPGIQITDSVFTILTWNLGYFGLGKECDFFYDGGKMTRPAKSDYLDYSARVLDYLGKAEKAGFYFFQEVDIKARRSYNDDQVARLRSVFPGMESSVAVNYKVSFVPVPLNNPMGRVKSGLVSFSSFHTVENNRYAFPGGYAWPVRLFQLDRCFLLSRLTLPGGKDLVLINTHNEAFDDGSQRKQQIAVLKDLMLSEYAKGNYVVTGGDWNQNPVGFSIGQFSNFDVGRKIDPAIEQDFFPQGWQWVFNPDIPTNRDVNQPYQKGKTKTTIIDFFVISPNVQAVSISTDDLGFAWSDHQPVRMRFKVK